MIVNDMLMVVVVVVNHCKWVVNDCQLYVNGSGCDC